MPRGGARPNSGPAKGTKYGPQATTISKEAAREALRTIVLSHMDALVAAQVANAKGLNYLVTRNKATGKFEKVTQERMEQLLDSDNQDELERVEVWQKDPSVQAFTDLLNRALDKPKEQEQEHAISGTLVVQWGTDAG